MWGAACMGTINMLQRGQSVQLHDSEKEKAEGRVRNVLVP